jgi:hypothetical protein
MSGAMDAPDFTTYISWTNLTKEKKHSTLDSTKEACAVWYLGKEK